jgi:hypothetical protein
MGRAVTGEFLTDELRCQVRPTCVCRAGNDANKAQEIQPLTPSDAGITPLEILKLTFN